MRKFYVVAVKGDDEFDMGEFDTLDEATAFARHEWSRMCYGDKKTNRFEVRQYLYDIEDEDCDCFDYNVFPWRTCGDYMKEKGGNLEWCKPYEADDGMIKFALNGGKLTGIVIDGKEFDDTELDQVDFEKLARRVNEYYDDYENRDDLYIILDASDELDCEECPFFYDCEAMTDMFDERNAVYR